MPKRAVGVKLERQSASRPKLEIRVESSIGSPECSSAWVLASIDEPVLSNTCLYCTKKWNVQSTEMPSAMLPVIIIPISTGIPRKPTPPKTSQIGMMFGTIAITPAVSDLSDNSITIKIVRQAAEKLFQKPSKISC